MTLRCPADLLDIETGGLIRMLTRLLDATSPLDPKPNVNDLAIMLGRCYALRDDYKNLSSTEVSKSWNNNVYTNIAFR